MLTIEELKASLKADYFHEDWFAYIDKKGKVHG